MALLQTVIALAIALAWGPELFAAMEMTALLEILGASLFLTAYTAGFKLKAIECGRALHSILFPFGQAAVMRSNARPSVKALAAASVVVNVAWCLGAILVFGMYGRQLIELAT